MATVFRKIQDGGIILHNDITNAFVLGFTTVTPYLVRIGQHVKKWQKFAEIPGGGGSHPEFWSLCTF